MHYWSWWFSGLALAGVAAAHWLVMRRMLAVSGRYTAIVDRLRFGGQPEAQEEMTPEEMAAAIRALTASTFGEEAIAQPAEPVEPSPAASKRRGPQAFFSHPLTLVGVLVGGGLSAVFDGKWEATFGLRSEALAEIAGGDGLRITAALLVGGILVGFGTRMAGGCTSGHGLCGVSRLQRGSALATLAFFAAGVATSILLGVL